MEGGGGVSFLGFGAFVRGGGGGVTQVTVVTHVTRDAFVIFQPLAALPFTGLCAASLHPLRLGGLHGTQDRRVIAASRSHGLYDR